MLRSRKKKRSKSDFTENIQKHQESPDNANNNSYLPNISQQGLQDTYSDDEIIGSMIGSRKKKRLLKSDFTANVQEQHESLKNTGQDYETINSSMKDTLHELNSLNNRGDAGETELLDDFIEPEPDNSENAEQRITDDRNSDANQKFGFKRRHKLVVDDDDD
ncbi:hypothetical protein GUJ93_ZPchr0005g14329 [Zizania palustris]|uniref:Uncharacterized protein n=1 Tax=Zizania palustris TaxID=103762 RepID=A0A8J5VS05_ZIZPA|nr:hypothetical protein GUJ93_ZPchr0005g14329 [Zizania palustris]